MKIELCDWFYYRVRDNDDIENLSMKFNCDKDNFVRNNCDIPLYAGEWVIIKQNDFISHLVRPMETLESVAKQYSMSIENLKIDNNLQTEKLFIGQTIKIFKK